MNCNSQDAVIYVCAFNPAANDNRAAFSDQTRRCVAFALKSGYQVMAIFEDQASGLDVSRAGFDEMISFLEARRDASPVVIIDEMTPLARDFCCQEDTKKAIRAAGGRIEYATALALMA